MRKLVRFVLVLVPVLTIGTWTAPVRAEQWLGNQEVVRINVYPGTNFSFVWTSTGPGTECQAAEPANPVLRFFLSDVQGRAVYTTLLTAAALGKRVDLRIVGCSIAEVMFLQ